MYDFSAGLDQRRGWKNAAWIRYEGLSLGGQVPDEGVQGWLEGENVQKWQGKNGRVCQETSKV